MKEEEVERLNKLSEYEKNLYLKGYKNIAGIDEAGRGPLAGPVVAAAVILPRGCMLEGVNDSKKVSEKKREKLYDDIINAAIAWGVGIIDNNVIDEINILNATRKAMHIAIDKLKTKPDYILIDAEKKYLLDRINKDDDVGKSGITYLHGKIVASDELDKAILKNFQTCGSIELFKED